jgi:hypothetical protein
MAAAGQPTAAPNLEQPQLVGLLLKCCLAQGSQAQRRMAGTVPAQEHAAAKTGRGTVATSAGRERRAAAASHAKSRVAAGRLLTTAVAGLAGLTSAIVLAATKLLNPTGAAARQHSPGEAASISPAIKQLLRQGVEQLTCAWTSCTHVPEVAADFIQVILNTNWVRVEVICCCQAWHCDGPGSGMAASCPPCMTSTFLYTTAVSTALILFDMPLLFVHRTAARSSLAWLPSTVMASDALRPAGTASIKHCGHCLGLPTCVAWSPCYSR